MPTGLEQARTLPVAAIGTALALATCTKPVATLASTATSLGSGPEGQAWILSSMSPGLAVGLLLAGAVGDGYGRNRAATSVLTALPARRLPGCVSSRAHLVKPAARRRPGRDSAEHSWHLALAAYLFAGAGQALETWRVLALLLRHDLPTQTQRVGSRPQRPPGDPPGRDTCCHRDARPATQSVRGERAGGFVSAGPAAPVEQLPDGPCTGSLRVGRAASVPPAHQARRRTTSAN
jgi:hypothetical protein